MRKQLASLTDLRATLAGTHSTRERLRVFASACVSAGICDSIAFELRDYSAICSQEQNDGIQSIVFRPYNSSFGVQNQILNYRTLQRELPCFLSRSESAEEDLLLNYLQVEALACFPVGSGLLEFRFHATGKKFDQKERFYLIQLVDYFRSSLLDGLSTHSQSQAVEQQPLVEGFKRVAEFGNIFILRADKNFQIKEFFGDTEFLFGVKRSVLLEQQAWQRFLNKEDLHKIKRLIVRMGDAPSEILQEIRILHLLSKSSRWFLLRASPVYDGEGNFSGWEGFGVDISDKRKIEEDLRAQSSRVEALYQVARAVRSSNDSAVLSLKGLLALLGATRSDCGFSCFYDEQLGRLEVIAAKGLSAEYIDRIQTVVDGNSLVRIAVEKRQGILLEDIQKDLRANLQAAKLEGLRSTIVMPLESEGEVLGAIVLFCRQARRYSLADFELVSAAASQIGLAIRQAEFFAAEKRQADSLAIMYRLSHELSKLLTAREVAEHTFPIVQEVLACKRMWLGMINEQGSHLIGQGGTGPGVRRSIKEIQIELDLRHDFLDQAISSKRAVIVPAGAEMQCSGLNRLVRRLDIGCFVIIPLVSLARVIGVLIIEPSIAANSLIQRKLPLLGSMASEIASVLLARRFESKIANADKMRMAGLLASGVAHNFNNLLQAVMGQASLIEMQVEEGSPLASSAQTIVDAASKGASLIKQLLSFSMQDGLDKRELRIAQMLEESKDLYGSLLGSGVSLKLDIEPDTPRVEVDYGQVQQIITNLLVNAKEAIADSPDGYVRIHARKVRLSSGEIDPELPPGDFLRIDIEDNGIGMDAERAQRCFEPFYTTKDVDVSTGIGLAGSGLGLSSAYSIARRHGGMLTVTSSPGEGTVFSLYLPEVFAEERTTALQIQHDHHRVLICGLDDSVSHSLRAMFYSLGFDADINSSGQKVLEYIKEKDEHFDLVVFDADRYGEILESDIQSLLTQYPGIHCIVSTIDSPFWAEIFADSPLVAVVEKPLGVWAIQPVVRRILGSRNLNGLQNIQSLQLDRAKRVSNISESSGLEEQPLARAAGGKAK